MYRYLRTLPDKLSFTSCKLSFIPDIVASKFSERHFEPISFTGCSFPPDSIAWLALHCYVMKIQVDEDLNMVLISADDADGQPELSAQIFSVKPINIHDAPDLPFRGSKVFIHKFYFNNVLDNRRRNPEGTMYYPSVKLVHFTECLRGINVTQTMSVLSTCCPNVKTFVVTNSQITLSNSQPDTPINVEEVHISHCRRVPLEDILLFLTTCCPSVKSFSITDSEITFDCKPSDAWNLSESSVDEIYFCNCTVPKSFIQELMDKCSFFKVSYFLGRRGEDEIVTEWSIVPRDLPSPMILFTPHTLSSKSKSKKEA